MLMTHNALKIVMHEQSYPCTHIQYLSCLSYCKLISGYSPTLLYFVGGFEPRIFQLATRFKSHTQVPRIRGYLRGFLCSTVLSNKVAGAEHSISHFYIILRTITGPGHIEKLERQYNFGISVYTDKPDAFYRVVRRQRVVVTGQSSCLRLQFDV